MNKFIYTRYLPTSRLFACATALAIALGTTACGEKPANTAESANGHASAESKEEAGLKLTAEEQERAGIKLETAALKASEDFVSVTATIRPNADRIAKIAPRSEGRIVSISANLGDVVRAGQSMAIMDSLVIGEAQATLLRAQSSERVALADYKRAESLSAEEIVPQKELLRARGELERATAEARAARDRLVLLGGSIGSSGRAESTFPLTAPFAGTVIQKNATVGELGSPSSAIFAIADLSTVWIEANLTDELLSKVKTGAAATVTVGAYPGESFTGRVAYIASALDKDSRTIAARIEVGNKDRRLKPEMFANANISTGSKSEAMSVPDGAILLLQGQPTVFIAEHGGYEARPVEVGEKLSGRTVIKSGLKAGDEVVVAGAYALKARMLKSQIGDAH